MLADLRPREEGPVTIVFGMFGWRHTIVRWAEHARRAGCSHYRIVCMDDGIAEFLRERGEAHRAVAFHDLVPDAPRVLRRPVLRALTNLTLRLAKRDWIFTSPVTIDGRFAGGLRVGIIPMYIVARGRFRGWGEPLVFHSSENKSTPRPADGAVDQFRHPAIIIPRNPASCRGRYHARRSHAADDERSADDPRSIQTDGASTGFKLIHYPGIAELRRTV